MSLLDKGSETVTIRARVLVDDGYGGTQPGPGPAMTMKVSMTPASTSSEGAQGYLVDTTYSMTARNLPDDIYDVVWGDDKYATDGDVRRHVGPARMSHCSVLLKKR